MTGVFGDTSYFVALLVPNDRHHKTVIEWSSASQVQLVTTEYVLAELGNFLAGSPQRHRFVKFLAELGSPNAITVIEGSSGLFHRAAKLYSERMDKHWSLIDCISFVVMSDRELRRVLTIDKHFEQAGFSLVLK
jgi:predicted nucleic acid-binding protein